MITINDPYNLVPQLFENFSEFEISSQATVDILPPGCKESFRQDNRLTVFIQPEPDMNWAPVAYAGQIAARPNNIFAVSGYSPTCDWNLPHWVLYLANLTMTVRVNLGIEPVDSGPKPYLATALLGGWMINRGLIVRELERHGVIDQCLVNYHDRAPLTEAQRQDWKLNDPGSAFVYRSPVLDSLDHPMFMKVAFQGTDSYTHNPIPLNTCQPIPDTAQYQHGWISQLIPRNIYNSAYLSIVAETECMACPDSFFVSEKISKPLIMGHPFVIFGCKDYLKNLHKLGFKTFASWIDESYDSLGNAKDRARALVQSVVDFSNKSEQEKLECMEQMKPVLEHNRRLACNARWSMAELVAAIKQRVAQ